MQVTKLRLGGDKGLVPAGRYFARLAENLRANNACHARETEEAQEHRLQTRYPKRAVRRRPSTIQNFSHA